jgi:hypothetical protein
VGAVVVLVGVPPAGAGVVLAGDAVGREVFVVAVVARVDDADLAVGGGRIVKTYRNGAILSSRARFF